MHSPFLQFKSLKWQISGPHTFIPPRLGQPPLCVPLKHEYKLYLYRGWLFINCKSFVLPHPFVFLSIFGILRFISYAAHPLTYRSGNSESYVGGGDSFWSSRGRACSPPTIDVNPTFCGLVAPGSWSACLFPRDPLRFVLCLCRLPPPLPPPPDDDDLFSPAAPLLLLLLVGPPLLRCPRLTAPLRQNSQQQQIVMGTRTARTTAAAIPPIIARLELPTCGIPIVLL